MGARRLVLVEGIPGSGKTSTAVWITERLREHGIASEWYREELADHPAIGRPLRRTASRPGYADRCVDGWRAFVDRAVAQEPGQVWVLEGCLFQSTVRFLLEYDHPEDRARRGAFRLGDRARAALRVAGRAGALRPRPVRARDCG